MVKIDEDLLALFVKAELIAKINGKKKALAAMIPCRIAFEKGYALTTIHHALKVIEICFGKYDDLYLDAAYLAYGINQRTMAEFRHFAKEIVNETRS